MPIFDVRLSPRDDQLIWWPYNLFVIFPSVPLLFYYWKKWMKALPFKSTANQWKMTQKVTIPRWTWSSSIYYLRWVRGSSKTCSVNLAPSRFVNSYGRTECGSWPSWRYSWKTSSKLAKPIHRPFLKGLFTPKLVQKGKLIRLHEKMWVEFNTNLKRKKESPCGELNTMSILRT